LESKIVNLNPGSKVVAPSAVWLYHPDLQLFGAEALTFAAEHQPAFNWEKQLDRLEPDLILYPTYNRSSKRYFLKHLWPNPEFPWYELKRRLRGQVFSTPLHVTN
jgi:hypothetical protein